MRRENDIILIVPAASAAAIIYTPRHLPLSSKVSCVSYCSRCDCRRHSSVHSGARNVLWDTRAGHKAFNLSAEFARDTRVLAANRGCITAFSRRGYVGAYGWGKRRPGYPLFLSCVLIAGVFGAVTASRKYSLCKRFRRCLR